MKWLAAMALMTIVVCAHGASTILLDYSPALECYKAVVNEDDREGLAHCTRAIEEQALNREYLAATHSNRAILLGRLGRLAEALVDHDRAIELFAEKSYVYINRANALVRAQRFEDGMRDLNHAISLEDEGLPAAYYNRSLLFKRLGDLRAARHDAELAARLSPESKAYHEYLSDLNRLNEATLAGER